MINVWSGWSGIFWIKWSMFQVDTSLIKTTYILIMKIFNLLINICAGVRSNAQESSVKIQLGEGRIGIHWEMEWISVWVKSWFYMIIYNFGYVISSFCAYGRKIWCWIYFFANTEAVFCIFESIIIYYCTIIQRWFSRTLVTVLLVSPCREYIDRFPYTVGIEIDVSLARVEYCTLLVFVIYLFLLLCAPNDFLTLLRKKTEYW